MYRGALCSILSELVRENRLLVIESFSIQEPKTRLLVAALKSLDVWNALIVVDDLSLELWRAARNLNDVQVCDVSVVDPVSLVSHDKVVFTQTALKMLERRLA
jgi:large subunit ribosomal protein L4